MFLQRHPAKVAGQPRRQSSGLPACASPLHTLPSAQRACSALPGKIDGWNVVAGAKLASTRPTNTSPEAQRAHGATPKQAVNWKGVAGARLGVGVKAPALVTGIDCYDGIGNPSGYQQSLWRIVKKLGLPLFAVCSILSLAKEERRRLP